MVFNTISVSTAVTPTVIETYISHYFNRKPLHQKPTAHVSYHEGLQLIRSFLYHASHHTVEDIQAFTSQWVPNPRWVRVEAITIPQKAIDNAADALIAQLGHKGVDKVGGSKWWQWRREGGELKAEWVEMRTDHERRKQTKEDCKRIMLYVHGGAYFFGSVDEHRAYSARYRLAPQFPFPCGLQDCLAAYLYLLTRHDASSIVLAGDSAGGGMILSVLVILRDQGFSLPAGAILISPWVDLTHSFPSVAGDAAFDYIPSHGFMFRSSAAWPPPNADDMEQIALHAVEKVVGEGMPRKSSQHERQVARDEAVQGFSVDHKPDDLHPEANTDNPAGTEGAVIRPGNTIPGPGHDLSIMLDGKFVTIKDQIQIYTTNQLISHPLVSPVLQPSLGGLPPLLIMTGGGELLRDEQIYLAHKAANPAKYPPGEAYMNDYPDAPDIIQKWKPTDVQLQVWDDLCHVAPTLSFTRPAKFMYRSFAQFGAWALAKAQEADIDIMDDDEVSVISSSSDSDSDASSELQKPRQEESTLKNGVAQGQAAATERVGRAGEPLPAFKNHMIRQRVDRNGNIFPLGPPSSLPALQMSSNDVGVIKPGPVRKWMNAKKEWDNKFAREKRRIQKQRVKEMAQGYQGFGDDEVPPPSALAGRRGLKVDKEAKQKRSWGMSLWSLWGSSHDQKTIKREEKADKAPETSRTSTDNNRATAPWSRRRESQQLSRSRSRRRVVSYTGQSDPKIDETTPALEILRRKQEAGDATSPRDLFPTFTEQQKSHFPPSQANSPIPSPSLSSDYPQANPLNNIAGTASLARPATDGKAFPFKLGTRFHEDGTNASTVTLMSHMAVGMPTPRAEGGREAFLSDADKVRAKQPSENGNGEKGRRRPEMERFETAREQM
ncbi:MAG: hypothetical protein Q9219_000367 [cf. Caloplaca sp. 3 TL-2023]